MNTAQDIFQKRKGQVISALLGINLVFGALVAGMLKTLPTPETAQAAAEEMQGSGIFLAARVITLVLCFFWLELDSRQLDIRRPWWLNVGVVLLPPVFLSYYLYKTRPADRRFQAILRLFGFGIGIFFAMVVGMVLALSMLPAQPSPAEGL